MVTDKQYSQEHSGLTVLSLEKSVAEFTIRVQMHIKNGERVGLFGKSGVGKTTFLRILSGLLPLDPKKDHGEIWLNGRNITYLPPHQRKIGFVFQEQILFDTLSVTENIAFGLRMQKVPEKERTRIVDYWLKKTSLESKKMQKILTLSGGEMQRIAFLRAIVWSPQLVILDEPFTALDTMNRDFFIKELIQLNLEYRDQPPPPILVVSHDIEDLAKSCHRIFEMTESFDMQTSRNTRSFLQY